MAYTITSLCLRDGACVEVCPVDCIVPGLPESEWPWYFIDPETCIDCGSCIPECPYEAIFADGEVPSAFELTKDQEVRPFGGVPYKEGGKIIDLTLDIPHNGDYFTKGPGYGALR